MKKNILTLSIAIIFATFLVEIIFIFFYPQPINTPFLTHDQNGLTLNIKNDSAIHSHQNKKFKYNFGEFHNRIYNFDKKKKKILVLGDSFTFGWLINDEDTFVYKLNNKFNNYYFVNAATGGWGSSDQLMYLIKYCNKIKPEKVLIFINSEDIFRSYNSNLFYLDNSNRLITGKNDVVKFSTLTENIFYKFLIGNLHSLRFIKKMYVNFFVDRNMKNNSISSQHGKKDFQNFALPQMIYKKIYEEVLNCNSELILINLAWENLETYEKLLFFKNNENYLKKNNFNYINLNNEMQIIQNNKENYEIEFDRHPNEKANEYFYKIISSKLERNFNF